MKTNKYTFISTVRISDIANPKSPSIAIDDNILEKIKKEIIEKINSKVSKESYGEHPSIKNISIGFSSTVDINEPLLLYTEVETKKGLSSEKLKQLPKIIQSFYHDFTLETNQDNYNFLIDLSINNEYSFENIFARELPETKYIYTAEFPVNVVSASFKNF